MVLSVLIGCDYDRPRTRFKKVTINRKGAIAPVVVTGEWLEVWAGQESCMRVFEQDVSVHGDRLPTLRTIVCGEYDLTVEGAW